jgi:hypothetical protein
MVLLLALLVIAGQTAALSPEEIKTALGEKRAITYEVKTTFSWKRNAWGGGVVAFASTPYSRLTWLAQSARERFEELTEADVAEALEDPSLCISTPISEIRVQSVVLIPHVIKDATPETVIKSAQTSTSIVETYNKLGGQWKEASYTACFPSGWKNTELDVIVVYQG